MIHEIGIIADDLTGANDSGVQLAEKGISTSVLFDIPENDILLNKGLVIDTNSRTLPPEDASSITQEAAEFLKKKNYSLIFKKMDSTLRGNIGIELQAINKVFTPEFIVVAPAFPALGRITIDGIHYVNGEKITNTEASKDPKHPVLTDSIPELLEKETGSRVGLLTKKDIGAGEAEFRGKINSFKEQDITYIVCDAETQDDLKDAVKMMKTASDNIVWAGSAGLTEVLPEVFQLEETKVDRFQHKCETVLTVCGTLSNVTQNQVKYAVQMPNVTGVELNPLKIFSDEWLSYKKSVVEEILTELVNKRDIVMYVPSNQDIRESVSRAGSSLGYNSFQVGERISNSIGEIVAEITARNKELNGLVLTGGDTAKDITRHLGGLGIRLVEQIEPGIPMGYLLGTETEFSVVTKAGAFGEESSIYNAIQKLKGV